MAEVHDPLALVGTALVTACDVKQAVAEPGVQRGGGGSCSAVGVVDWRTASTEVCRRHDQQCGHMCSCCNNFGPADAAASRPSAVHSCPPSTPIAHKCHSENLPAYSVRLLQKINHQISELTDLHVQKPERELERMDWYSAAPCGRLANFPPWPPSAALLPGLS